MLRVSRLTDYATLLMGLLAQGTLRQASASELAAQSGLETPTVAKVLRLLARAGLVESTRGATGGYRLARAAGDITLAEIVEAMEGPLAVTECSVHVGTCGIEHACGMRPAWRQVNDVIADALRNVSLAGLTPHVHTPARRRIAIQMEPHA